MQSIHRLVFLLERKGEKLFRQGRKVGQKHLVRALHKLREIWQHHRKVIEGDVLLKKDMKALESYLTIAAATAKKSPEIATTCDKIMAHLLEEAKECIHDEHRNQDESPAWAASAGPEQAQKYFTLYKALKEFSEDLQKSS